MSILIPNYGELSHLNVAPDGEMDIDGKKLKDRSHWPISVIGYPTLRGSSTGSWKEPIAMSNCCTTMPLNLLQNHGHSIPKSRLDAQM